MSAAWETARDAVIAGAGGSAALLLRTAAKWIRIRMLAARVNREAKDGPAFGTVGWVWNELTRSLDKVRSKGHSTEAWCSQNAERLASLETVVFGATRMQSGEQERIDFARERLPSRVPSSKDADTEPEPLPAFTSERPTTARRRSRP